MVTSRSANKSELTYMPLWHRVNCIFVILKRCRSPMLVVAHWLSYLNSSLSYLIPSVKHSVSIYGIKYTVFFLRIGVRFAPLHFKKEYERKQVMDSSIIWIIVSLKFVLIVLSVIRCIIQHKKHQELIVIVEATQPTGKLTETKCRQFKFLVNFAFWRFLETTINRVYSRWTGVSNFAIQFTSGIRAMRTTANLRCGYDGYSRMPNDCSE